MEIGHVFLVPVLWSMWCGTIHGRSRIVSRRCCFWRSINIIARQKSGIIIVAQGPKIVAGKGGIVVVGARRVLQARQRGSQGTIQKLARPW